MNEQATILVVDDDSSIRWVLARALHNAEYKVISCDNGTEAIELVNTHQPNIVITDIQMSGMSGLELLEKLNQSHPSLPVIMITAYADTDIGSQTHDLGAFDYLPKPFNINQVINICRKALDSRQPDTYLPAWQQQIHKTIEQHYHQGQTKILQQIQDDFERFIVDNALRLTHGHKQKAAKLLGWGRNTLTRKLQQWQQQDND
ncbi:response regulator [Kangiella koreensis]|uniref:Two component transcriptional regulator, Fis family n=1 Tax=Kangiella koreensis (strain DSM 16069 / JCM 12317 / KCTC 12182 / SW-125) TaxID=523791 RepID=C7R8D5_KANKD|nr:response regulator [Kangiella koreensis]ACV27700.1 two component transcriptional regulator, Fis family [Kangiella koreensis DSM 16069]